MKNYNLVLEIPASSKFPGGWETFKNLEMHVFYFQMRLKKRNMYIYIYIYIYQEICIYVCMYVCTYVCMYKCMYVCIYGMYICRYGMYICIHVCKDILCIGTYNTWVNGCICLHDGIAVVF